MQTIYDWATMAVFCVIAVLFIQRSIGPEIEGDRMVNYLPPTIGCAVANYFGNKDSHVVAILLLAVTVVYVVKVLKPFPTRT
jgi:hypothetical protein